MTKRLKFLSGIEPVVIERLPQLEQQDVVLVTQVYALYGLGSTLFYLDLERFLGLNVQTFSGEAVADLLNSILLVHQKMRSKILDAFEAVLTQHEFTPSQAIKILRAYEFMGRPQFEGKELLLSVIHEADPKKLAIVEQLQALEIIQANYYLNRVERPFVESLNQSISQAGWSIPSGKTASLDEPANILACLADPHISRLISPDNLGTLKNFIRLSIIRGKTSEASLLASALHRYDQGWDHGMWDRREYIAALDPVVQAFGEVAASAKANLTLEERLSISNLLAKVCHPPWNGLANMLLTE